MAKYTELLSEYLENGGALPAAFDNISGFKTLFIGKYCDCEIGFETPVLFAIKLETRANAVIPAYAARIAAIESAMNNLSNPTKKRVKSGNISRDYGARNYSDNNLRNGSVTAGGTDTHTINNGDVTTTEKDFPFTTIDESDPTAGVSRQTVQTSGEDKDTNEHNNTETYNNLSDNRTYNEDPRKDTETYNNITEEETGATLSENLALLTALENEVYLIQVQLLSEFNNLFMQVY